MPTRLLKSNLEKNQTNILLPSTQFYARVFISVNGTPFLHFLRPNTCIHPWLFFVSFLKTYLQLLPSQYISKSMFILFTIIRVVQTLCFTWSIKILSWVSPCFYFTLLRSVFHITESASYKILIWWCHFRSQSPWGAFLNTQNKIKLLVSHTSFLLLLYSSSSGLIVICRTFHIWYLFKEFAFTVSFYWNILDSDSTWLTSSLYWDFCSNFPIHIHFILIFYCNSYFYLALHDISFIYVFMCVCVYIHLYIWTLT